MPFRSYIHSYPQTPSTISKISLFLLVFAPVLAASFGCGGEGGGTASQIQAVSITVTPGSATVNAGSIVQFTATVSGSSNANVTWGVGGIAGGNSTLGTINGSGLYTAPAVLPNPATVTVSATAQADSTKTASASVTVVAKLAINKISNASPVAMTVLSLSTVGVISGTPLQATFSNAAGFTHIEQALSVATDGTVNVAVPLYADPATAQITAGTVSLVLTQGNQTTSPVSILIQELPPISTYNAKLGQISHGFLQYEAMLIGRRINQLQAYQALPGNTADTTATQTQLQALLQAVIQARGDVDQIALNNSLVIPGGTLGNGATLQFDQNSVDMMDRVFGQYLSQISPSISAAAQLQRQPASRQKVFAKSFSPVPGAQLPVGSYVTLIPISRSARKHQPPVSETAMQSASSGGTPLGVLDLLAFLTTAKNTIGAAQATQEMYKNDSTAFDRQLAYQKAIGAYLGMAGILNPGVAKVASAYGLMVASESLIYNLGMEAGDLAFLAKASMFGGDPRVFNEALQDAADRNKQVASAAWDFEMSAVDLVTPASSLGKLIHDFAESNAGKLTLQTLDLLKTGFDCGEAKCLSQVENTSQELANETKQSTSPGEGFVELQGQVNITYSQGTFLAAQSGIGIENVDGGSVTILADPSGAYDEFFPLGAQLTTYSSLTIEVFDPEGNLTLATQVINLSNASSGTVVTIVTMIGTCNDPDANSGDGDDPDCD